LGMDPRLRALVQLLASPLQEQRDRARAELLAAGPASVPALVEALRSTERDIRAGAALCLGALGAADAADALAGLATADPDRSVRPLALRALADIASPAAPLAVKRALIDHLTDDDLFARALACTGLGRIGDDLARQALQLALRDREEWVRDAARKALAPSPASATPGSAAPGTAMVHVPPGAVAPSPEQRAQVAQLGSAHIEEQRQAQAALVALGAAAVPQVAALLRSGEASTRRAAAEVLGSVGAVDGLAPLTELLDDDRTPDDQRAVALHAVAAILQRAPTGQLFAEETVRQHLEHDDPFVRGAALAALISARGPALRDTLEACLAVEEDGWVFAAACRALCTIAAPEERALLPVLLDLLARSTEPDAQLQLLEALRRLLPHPGADGEQVVGPASYFLQSEEQAVRRTAAELIAAAAQTLDPTMVRELAALIADRPAESLALIRAVGRLSKGGDPAVLLALRRALVSKERGVSEAATAALIAIGGAAAIDLLVEVANSRGGPCVAIAAQTLAAMDPRAEVVAVRAPDGRWERIVQHRCGCGGLLRWLTRDGREQLRCPDCDLEHVLSAAGKLFAAERTPFGTCLCPTCRRKQPLVRRGDTEVIVCPASGNVHIRPFDFPRQIRLLGDLPLGACSCCAEPQPLIRVNEDVRCYRTRTPYRATPRGFEQAAEGVPVADDVEAINRALLMGTLGIAESGLVAPDDDEG
jgi:HEAT repeat protein